MFIIALIICNVLYIPALIHTIIDGIRYNNFTQRLSQSFRSQAIALDVFGNVAYASLLNAFFIDTGGYHFGNQCETVSEALGQNHIRGTLTFMGKGLVGMLGLLQKDHCWNSIKNKPEDIIKPQDIKLIYTISFIVILVSIFTVPLILIFI